MGTNATSGQFDQVEVSKNLSQLIRSNTPHYWTYMKHRADLSSLKQYLPFEGIVGGDPHMGNFTVLPLKQVGGSRQMRYVDIDFDDAGRGPFVLDIIRYLIASKSIGGQIKKRPLEISYLAGIAGKELDPPKEVRSLLAMPVSDYDDMVTRYVEKNSSNHGFVFRKGKIERYNAKIARSTIERLFTAAKVIDLAIRPEERGGSVDQLRIWVLVEHQKSRRIVELKQYSKPAIANYQAQPPVHEWLNEIRRTLEIDYRRTKGRICIFRSDRSCEFRAGLSRPARLFQNMNGASAGSLRVTFLSRRSLCMRQSAQRRLRPMTYVTGARRFLPRGFSPIGASP
jgi:hypothetical protein